MLANTSFPPSSSWERPQLHTEFQTHALQYHPWTLGHLPEPWVTDTGPFCSQGVSSPSLPATRAPSCGGQCQDPRPSHHLTLASSPGPLQVTRILPWDSRRAGRGASLCHARHPPSTAALLLQGGSSCRLQKPVLSSSMKSREPSPPLLLHGEIISREFWPALLVRSPCRAEPSWVNEAVMLEKKGTRLSAEDACLLANSMTCN